MHTPRCGRRYGITAMQETAGGSDDRFSGLSEERRSDPDGDGSQDSEQERYRSETHQFVCQLVQSAGLNRLTVGVIVLNTVSIGAETFRALKMAGSFAVIFGALDLVFVSYYTMELTLKIYSYPRSFWVSRYNQFDVFVLATSYVQLAQDIFGAALLPIGNVTFLRVLRALRALRALRGISFIRSLQVLVAALRTTVSEVLNLVLLLALLMYIFGIMGYYFFGSAEYAGKGLSTSDWESLGAACMSLFVFVTADGWSDLQAKLDEDGYTGSKLFTVLFLLVGHFIFINIFIGVVIRNIEQAAHEEASWQAEQRASSYLAKKRAAIAEQDSNLSRKMQQDGGDSFDGSRFSVGSAHSDRGSGDSEGRRAQRDDGIGEEWKGPEYTTDGVSKGKQHRAHDTRNQEKDLVVQPRQTIAHPMWVATYLGVLKRQRTAMGQRLALQHNVARHLTAAVEAGPSSLGRDELQAVITGRNGYC